MSSRTFFRLARDTYDTFSYPDKVRGLLNEGGLFGERQGWHLPGFDTSGWEARDLSAGLPNGAAGVGFFVTTFDLDIPAGTDVPISFQFEETNDQPYRALVFVNGWQFGKRVANVGPQTKFPVPQGVLDYSGKKCVLSFVWLVLALTVTEQHYRCGSLGSGQHGRLAEPEARDRRRDRGRSWPHYSQQPRVGGSRVKVWPGKGIT